MLQAELWGERAQGVEKPHGGMSAAIIQAGFNTAIIDQLCYKQLLTQQEELLTDYHVFYLLAQMVTTVTSAQRASRPGTAVY